MNNNQPKRNKLPLILAALLSIGLIAYGSFAYFTDEATQEAGLKLTLGSIDIQGEAKGWKYEPEGESNPDLNLEKDGEIIRNASDIINVLPGDKFTNTFKFKNNGDNEFKIVNTTDTLDSNGPFHVEVKEPMYFNKENEQITFDSTHQNLKTDEYLEVQVSVSIDHETIGDEYNKGNAEYKDLNEITLDLLNKAYKVEVAQTNK